MQQRPTVRARVMRVSLSLLVGLAAVAIPLWALGPGFGGGSSDNPAANLPVGDGNASLTSLSVPAAGDLQLAGSGDKVVVAELGAENTQHYGMVGVTWIAGTGADDLEVEVRVHDASTGWTGWQALVIDDDGPSESDTQSDTAEDTQVRAGTKPTWVGTSDGVAVRLLSGEGAAPEDVQVALIDGGTGLAEAPGSDPSSAQLSGATSGGIPPRPTIITRKQWGVDRSSESSCDTPNTVPTMKGIVLHHTVNSNDYTAAEAPGIVRAIHLYHTKSRGWCDVGYNFLVDKYGVIYQGRRGGITKQVRGAHAGNWDVNTYTTGISMIGNFENAIVPPALQDAVVRFMAWRLASFGVNPMGTAYFGGHTIPAIAGHRDVYKSGIRPATATACPGKYAYDWLVNGDLRRRVAQMIADAPPPSESPSASTSPSVSISPSPSEPPPPSVSRVAADDRYATAAAIAKDTFTGPVGAVFLASGENFPDALSAGPAAGRRGPVLLTQGAALPDETAAALKQLMPSTIYVLGGENAVSATAAQQAASYAPVVRLAGYTRYGTGKLISKQFWPEHADTVYLASGLAYPDALSGGVLAARQNAPVLLSGTNRIPKPTAKTLTRLAPTRVVMLGGTVALSDAVTTQVRQLLPSAAVSRIAGADRFATSALVARTGWSASEIGYFASALNFPDALAGVPAAAAKGGPLLLARPRCLPAPVYGEVESLGMQDRILLGGALSLRDGAATRQCAR